jgi:hypothetical protein
VLSTQQLQCRLSRKSATVANLAADLGCTSARIDGAAFGSGPIRHELLGGQCARNLEDAIARLEDLLRTHRNEPSAEYVANMLLDALARANRIPELKQWLKNLLADSTFLAGKGALINPRSATGADRRVGSVTSTCRRRLEIEHAHALQTKHTRAQVGRILAP